MIEAIIAIAGIIGGFLIALGWYRRGFVEVEKEIIDVKNRLSVLEKEYQGIHVDLEVIKNRMFYMETKLDDIHNFIIRPKQLE